MPLAGACVSTYDCANTANGIVCNDSVCTQVNTVAAGPTGYCGQPDEVCAVDSYCNTAVTPNVCTEDGILGASCSASIPCKSTLRCEAGTCQPRVEQGAGPHSCATNADCDPTTVPYCDPFDGFICTTGLIFAPQETPLCQNYGGGATPFDAGTPTAPVAVDSGTGTTVDSGGTTPADSGAD